MTWRGGPGGAPFWRSAGLSCFVIFHARPVIRHRPPRLLGWRAHLFSRRSALVSWGLVHRRRAMTKSVLTVPQAFGMSLLVYGGSSQLAVLPLFAARLPVWTVLLTAAGQSALRDLQRGIRAALLLSALVAPSATRVLQRRHHFSDVFQAALRGRPPAGQGSVFWGGGGELAVVADLVDRGHSARAPDSR